MPYYYKAEEDESPTERAEEVHEPEVEEGAEKVEVPAPEDKPVDEEVKSEEPAEEKEVSSE